MAELPGGIKRTVPLVPTTDRRTPLVNTGALYENINLLDGTPTRKREHYVGDFGRKVSWGELAEASMHIDNDPYNWWKAWEKSRIENEFSWDPEYKVKMEDLVGTPFEDNWDLLLDSNIQSAEHLEFLTDWYTRELEMRERLALGGARTFATSGLAGIVSPISMIPVGAGLKGASLLRGGVRGAGAAFLGAGISETGLHLTQQYRTGTETAFGVTAGVLLGSALGGLAGGLSGRSLRKAHRTTSRLLDSPIPSVVIDHGIYRVATDATRKALEEARHRAIVKEGRPLTDEEFLRIFRETSEEYADEDAITGLYDDELRLFFTTRPLLESDTVVGGSNFALTPDQLRAAAAERQIDAEAWVRFGDAERDIPIESASEEVLTTAQRALLEQLRVRAQAAGDNEELVGQLDDLQADFLERAGAVEEFHRLQQEMNELEVRLRDPEAEPFTEEETFAFLQKRARAIWLRRRIAEALDPDKVSMVEGLMREVGLDPDAVRAGTFGETALRRVWADAIEADADVRGGPAPIFDEQGGFNRGFEPEEATPTPHAAEGAAPTESRVVRDEERVVVSEPTVTRVDERTGAVQTTQVVRIGRHEWTITETTSERTGAKSQTMKLRGVDPETGEPLELRLAFSEGKHIRTNIRVLSGEAEGVTSEAATGKFFFEEPNHEDVGLATNARRHTLDDNPNAIFPRVDTVFVPAPEATPTPRAEASTPRATTRALTPTEVSLLRDLTTSGVRTNRVEAFYDYPEQLSDAERRIAAITFERGGVEGEFVVRDTETGIILEYLDTPDAESWYAAPVSDTETLLVSTLEMDDVQSSGVYSQVIVPRADLEELLRLTTGVTDPSALARRGRGARVATPRADSEPGRLAPQEEIDRIQDEISHTGPDALGRDATPEELVEELNRRGIRGSTDSVFDDLGAELGGVSHVADALIPRVAKEFAKSLEDGDRALDDLMNRLSISQAEGSETLGGNPAGYQNVFPSVTDPGAVRFKRELRERILSRLDEEGLGPAPTPDQLEQRGLRRLFRDHPEQINDDVDYWWSRGATSIPHAEAPTPPHRSLHPPRVAEAAEGRRVYRFNDGTEITISGWSHLERIEVPEGLRRQGVATQHISEVEEDIGHRIETGTAGSDEGLALMNRLGIRDVAAPPPSAATLAPRVVEGRDIAHDPHNISREHQRLIALDQGVPEDKVDEFLDLTFRVRAAEKNPDQVEMDPVTRRNFTAVELMDQLESEGQPRMGAQFSRRRNYTSAEISEFQAWGEMLEDLEIHGMAAVDLQWLVGVLDGNLPVTRDQMAAVIRRQATSTPRAAEGVDRFPDNEFVFPDTEAGRARRNALRAYDRGRVARDIGVPEDMVREFLRLIVRVGPGHPHGLLARVRRARDRSRLRPEQSEDLDAWLQMVIDLEEGGVDPADLRSFTEYLSGDLGRVLSDDSQVGRWEHLRVSQEGEASDGMQAVVEDTIGVIDDAQADLVEVDAEGFADDQDLVEVDAEGFADDLEDLGYDVPSAASPELRVLSDAEDVLVPAQQDAGSLPVPVARGTPEDPIPLESATAPDYVSPFGAENTLYHGSRSVNIEGFIDADGNLVLHPGHQLGVESVSFHADIDVAVDYATRSGGVAAVRKSDGLIFEIRRSALRDVDEETFGEMAVHGPEPVVIGPEDFRIIDIDPEGRIGPDDLRGLSDEELAVRAQRAVTYDELQESLGVSGEAPSPRPYLDEMARRLRVAREGDALDAVPFSQQDLTGIDPVTQRQVEILAEREAEGWIQSRVQNMQLNDAEFVAERGRPDTRSVTEIAGIGRITAAKLAEMEIHTVNDLIQALAEGKNLPGIGPRIREHLEAEAPPPGGGSGGGAGAEAPPPGGGHDGVPLEAQNSLGEAVAQAFLGEHLIEIMSNVQGRIFLRSPWSVFKRGLQTFVITDVKLTKNYAGHVPEESIEGGIKVRSLEMNHALRKVHDIWKKWAKGQALDDKTPISRKNFMASRVVDRTTDRRVAGLGERDFGSHVLRALRNDGHAYGLPDLAATPYVEAAARVLREEVLLKTYKEMAERFNWPKHMNQLSYALRDYNVVKIRANMEAFKKAMIDDLMDQAGTTEFVGGVKIEHHEIEAWSRGRPGSVERAEELVDEWIEGILSTPYTRSAPNLSEIQLPGSIGAGRAGRSRPVEVRDKALEPWLNNDLLQVMSKYLHTKIPDLEISKMWGDVNATRFFEAAALQAEAAISRAPEFVPKRTLAEIKAGVPQQKSKSDLQKIYASNVRDIQEVIKILRHTKDLPSDPTTVNGKVERVLSALKGYNFLRIGGGFGVTAFGDVGGMALLNGSRRTLGGFVEDFRNLAGSDILSMPRRDLDDLGIDFYDVLALRPASIWNIGDYGGMMSMPEGMFNKAAKKMAFLNLLLPWTNYVKQTAARGVTRRIIEVAEKIQAGSATRDEIATLARAHITPEMAIEILKMQQRWGGKRGRTTWLGAGQWQGPNSAELRRIMRLAIAEDVDRAIVTPGVGDTPFFLHSKAGKVLFQFRRFGIAHTTKILIPAAQGLRSGDLSVLNAVGISVGMGSVVYMLKHAATKREIPTDINRILQEGIVRSDIWGSIGEMDGFFSAATAHQFGFRQFLGPDTYHGMRKRDGWFDGMASMTMGPTYSSFMEAARSMGGMGDLALGDGLSDVSPAQIRAWRRIMPYQNLFYMDWLFDAMENGLESAGRRDNRKRVMLRTMGAQ